VQKESYDERKRGKSIVWDEKELKRKGAYAKYSKGLGKSQRGYASPRADFSAFKPHHRQSPARPAQKEGHKDYMTAQIQLQSSAVHPPHGSMKDRPNTPLSNHLMPQESPCFENPGLIQQSADRNASPILSKAAYCFSA
jgi:hypothetical protein